MLDILKKLGLSDLLAKIRQAVERQVIVAQKDNVLIPIIHKFIVEHGWIPREIRYGFDEHELEYIKQGKELEIKAVRIGSRLHIVIEIEHKVHLSELLELFGLDDIFEKEKKHYIDIDLNDYVDDNLNVNIDKARELAQRIISLAES